MPTWLIIILLAILAVGLFVLAMSLTLIFKGHHSRLRNFHQRKHAQTGYQMRRSGDPRTDDGTRRLRIGARMLGQLRRLHPRSGSRSTRLRKKINRRQFSATENTGNLNSDYPCFYFLGFNPRCREAVSPPQNTPRPSSPPPTCNPAFYGRDRKPRINQIRLVVTQRTIIRQRKRFAPTSERINSPAAVSHSYVEVVRK